MRFHIFSIFLILTIVGGCAKKREAEPVGDADTDRWSKETFLTTNDWMSKITIVNTSSMGGVAFVGGQSSLQVGRFEFTKDKLKFLKAINPENERLEVSDLIDSWDITHTEYRLAESEGRVVSREEENNYITWENKRFFTIDFSTSEVPIDMNNNCWEKVSSEMVDGSQSITPEHIIFDIEVTYSLKDPCLTYSRVRRYTTDNYQHTVRYRYSFAPLPESDYKPYKYAGEKDPLWQKYGYFTTEVEKMDEYGMIQSEFLMNRWHPEKTHTIYLAPGFPEEYKWIYTDPEFGIGKRTNDLFERNGIPTRFQFEDAPEGVKFGDVRYSFVNFVDELSSGAPLGYGPSDTNPLTGEILRSDSMIWTGYLKWYVKRIQDELANNAERYADGGSTLVSKMTEHLGPNPSEWTSTGTDLEVSEFNGTSDFNSESGTTFQFLLPSYTYSRRGNLHASTFGDVDAHTEPQHSLTGSIQKVVDMIDRERYPDTFDEDFEKILLTFEQKVDELNNNVAWEPWQQYDHKLANQQTIYDAEEALANLTAQGVSLDDLIDDKSAQQIVDTMLYRVAIHEFGHNLNLRHNFYGSVDARHFGDRQVESVDRDGNLIYRTKTTWDEEQKKEVTEFVLDADGNKVVKLANRTTSTVMDYKGLIDEMNDVFDWEAYDEAALTFAYTGGQKDFSTEQNTTYLYCTDEHRVINAMCAAWDVGYTPSQIVKSLIERYDNRYWLRNYRYDRQFWHTGNYTASVLDDLVAPYKFLAFFRETYGSNMKQYLSERGTYSSEEIDALVEPINEDFKQAILMTASFYDGIIRQSSRERPWSDEYDDFTGALERKGIAVDKIYATLLLLGDPMLTYARSSTQPYSFVDFLNDPQIGPQIDDIMIKNITVKPSMEQGFIGFGRSLYAITAANYMNIDSRSEAILKVEFQCYTPQSLKRYLGLDPNNFKERAGDEPGVLNVATIMAEDIRDVMFLGVDPADIGPYENFVRSSNVGIIEHQGNYYIATFNANAYAYKMIEDAEIDASNGYAIQQQKIEIKDMYDYVRYARGLNLTEGCK